MVHRHPGLQGRWTAKVRAPGCLGSHPILSFAFRATGFQARAPLQCGLALSRLMLLCKIVCRNAGRNVADRLLIHGVGPSY
jgi:hypothetical protein